MAKNRGRSPNYPQLTMHEALERVRKIYNKEHTHAAPKEVIAQHLGYGGLNGASLTMIGSLRRYNLIEPVGDGLRVSTDAVTLIELPTSDPQHKAALNRALFAPALFSELRALLGNTLPSEANLRHTLILKGFMPKAANEIIRVYRENMSLADFSEPEYNDAVSTDDGEESTVSQTIETKPIIKEAVGQAGRITGKTYPMDISNVRNVSAELRIVGELTREDVVKLRRQIERQIASIEDGFDE